MGLDTVQPKKAVCLLSGGLDSSTCLGVARRKGYECYALSFDYGQRHRRELEAAARVAEQVGVREHRVVRIDLRQFGGSALTSDDLSVPKGRTGEEMSAGIPVTYVPARNTVFLSFALAWAEVIGARDIFLGVNAIDYSGYPDCRPEFLEAFARMANLGTRAVEGGEPLRIHAPLIAMTKGEIVREALRVGLAMELTHSCYDPDPAGRACGECDSCLLRLKGFAEAGVEDPVEYTKR